MAETKINGRQFSCSPLPAGEAIELYAELMEVAGPAASKLPAIIVSLTGGAEHGRIMADVATLEAFSAIVKASGAPRVRALVAKIVAIASIRRPSGAVETCDLDGDFQGDLKDVLDVVRFVLREQYYDFFLGREGGGLLGLLKATLTSTK